LDLVYLALGLALWLAMVGLALGCARLVGPAK
jgi:hypothetical protein